MDNLTPAQRTLHRNFVTSVQSLRSRLVRTIYYLAAVKSQGIHRLLGYRRIADYAAHFAGLTPRQTKDFLFIARRLPDLPAVAAALERGELGWTTVRDICRRAGHDDREEWLELARSISLHGLNSLSEALPSAPDGAASTCGSPADAPPVSASPQHGTASPTVTDSRNQLSPSEIVTRSPDAEPPERPHEECVPSDFEDAGAVAAGPRQPVESRNPARDLEFVTLRFTGEQLARLMALREALSRSAGITSLEDIILHVLATGAGSDATRQNVPYLVVILTCPDCGQTRLPTPRGERPAPRSLLDAARCDAVIEDEYGRRRHVVRPTLRRLALQRARYRCEARGCSHTAFLEIHHRRPVASGGRDDLEDLIVLCSACHRRLHEADARARDIAAAAPDGLTRA